MLSIVIPTNKLDDKFACCLQAIVNAKKTNKIEFIVVLDGVANSSDFFKSFDLSELRILELENNKGPAFARNHGANKAKGELLLFIDADVVIQADSIIKIEKWFSQSDSSDALIGLYDDMPSDQSLISKFRNLLHHYTHLHASTKATTFWAGFGAIRKDVFSSLGGFESTYKKPSVEDIEFGYRLIKEGHEITLNKEIRVKHLKTWTLSNMLYTDIFCRAAPWSQLLLRYKNIKQNDLNIKPTEKLTATLLALLLVSLLLSVKIPVLWVSSACLITIIFILQTRFYTFLFEHFSLFQFPMAIMLHWLYYFSAMAGLMVGLITNKPKRSVKPARQSKP